MPGQSRLHGKSTSAQSRLAFFRLAVDFWILWRTSRPKAPVNRTSPLPDMHLVLPSTGHAVTYGSSSMEP